MMNELKPCPFCGGEARLNNVNDMYWVYCPNCLCSGPSVNTRVTGEVKWNNSEQEGIEVWNRRKSDGEIH